MCIAFGVPTHKIDYLNTDLYGKKYIYCNVLLLYRKIKIKRNSFSS